MKKWHYILVLLLFSCVLFSCKSNSISFEFPKEVQSMLKEDGFYLGDYYYYGDYDGAVVCFAFGIATEVFHTNVAGVDFWWSTNAKLLVYKEKKLYSLEEAYDLGFLTEKNVKSVLKYHKQLYDREHGKGEYERVFGQ